MKGLWAQTEREKQGTIDGIGLFFGALLGTNLAILDGLALHDYAIVIFVLAASVMTLRIFSTSERRWHAYLLLGLYVAFVAHFLLGGGRPDGLSEAGAHRIAVTLGIWLVCVLTVEFYPTISAEEAE